MQKTIRWNTRCPEPIPKYLSKYVFDISNEIKSFWNYIRIFLLPETKCNYDSIQVFLWQNVTRDWLYSTPKLPYNERARQTSFVCYTARFTISNMNKMSQMSVFFGIFSANMMIFHISSHYFINITNTLLSFATPHPNSWLQITI